MRSLTGTGCGLFCTVALVLPLLLGACSGPGMATKVTIRGEQARIVLCLMLPPSVSEEGWQAEMYEEIQEEAKNVGLTPVDVEGGACDALDEGEADLSGLMETARERGAHLLLTKSWKRTPEGCSYEVKVYELESGIALVEESGEARRGCTDRGLARPITVSAKMAVQQAAYLLRRGM